MFRGFRLDKRQCDWAIQDLLLKGLQRNRHTCMMMEVYLLFCATHEKIQTEVSQNSLCYTMQALLQQGMHPSSAVANAKHKTHDQSLLL